MKTKTKLILLAVLVGVFGLVFGYIGTNTDVEEVEQEREDTTIVLPEGQEQEVEEPLIDVESELDETELEEVEEVEDYGDDLDNKI